MEAMKRNFLLRGFFNRRGYFDLDSISPPSIATGVLENGKRKAMRIWLSNAVLFEAGPDGTESAHRGRPGADRLRHGHLPRYLPANPLVVEGYATARQRRRPVPHRPHAGGIVREYVMDRYELMPQHTGFIALGSDAHRKPIRRRLGWRVGDALPGSRGAAVHGSADGRCPASASVLEFRTAGPPRRACERTNGSDGRGAGWSADGHVRGISLLHRARARTLRDRIEPAMDDLRNEFARFQRTIEKVGEHGERRDACRQGIQRGAYADRSSIRRSHVALSGGVGLAFHKTEEKHHG